MAFFTGKEAQEIYKALPKPVYFRFFKNSFSSRSRDFSRQFRKKDRHIFVFANVMIIAPLVLFAVFCLPTLNSWNPAITVIWSLLVAGVFVTMYKTSFVDPGYLPRNLDVYGDDTYDTRETEQPQVSEQQSAANATSGLGNTAAAAASSVTPWTAPVNYPYSQPNQLPIMADFKKVVLNGFAGTLKYCNTCNTYRSPRASHCSTCDRCVDALDHHCPWMANCIGRRNYRYFYAFVCLTSVLDLYCLAFSLVTLFRIRDREGVTFGDAIGKSIGSLIVLIYCIAMGFSVVGLCGFHTFLVSLNITTREHLRLRIDRELYRERQFDRSPSDSRVRSPEANSERLPRSRYSKGNMFYNCFFILFRSQSPSFDFRVEPPRNAPSDLTESKEQHGDDVSNMVFVQEHPCAALEKAICFQKHRAHPNPLMAEISVPPASSSEPRWNSIYTPQILPNSDNQAESVTTSSSAQPNVTTPDPALTRPLVNIPNPPAPNYMPSMYMQPTVQEARRQRWALEDPAFFQSI